MGEPGKEEGGREGKNRKERKMDRETYFIKTKYLTASPHGSGSSSSSSNISHHFGHKFRFPSSLIVRSFLSFFRLLPLRFGAPCLSFHLLSSHAHAHVQSTLTSSFPLSLPPLPTLAQSIPASTAIHSFPPSFPFPTPAQSSPA